METGDFMTDERYAQLTTCSTPFLNGIPHAQHHLPCSAAALMQRRAVRAPKFIDHCPVLIPKGYAF